MSLHPSLKIDTAGAQQRTVLTRIERIKDLMKKGIWHDEHSVTGLPKTKIIRIKAAKKEKKEEVAEGAEGATAAAAPASAPEAKAKTEAKSKTK
jgi:small basic protein (TIGR04137 family)